MNVDADTVTTLATLLGVELAGIGAFLGSRWFRRIHAPGEEISFWLEDGALIVQNRSNEPIFDVVPFVWDPRTKERKVFKYLPSNVDLAGDVDGISASDQRVPFYSINMPPGMWAVELGIEEPDPKTLGLAFENTAGLLFRLQQGRVKTHVAPSIGHWFNIDLSHRPELEFTRLNEEELGVPFQQMETERSVQILSSSAQAKEEIDLDTPTEQPARS